MSEHRVRIDSDIRQIVTDRIHSARSAVLFTSLSFEDALAMGFDEFARQLSENLVFDTPELRQLFKR